MIDKDLARFKFVDEDGVIYYYAEKAHLVKALTDGGSAMIRMASYIVCDRWIDKSRSFDTNLANAILAIGRDKINELFDFMGK